MPFSLKKASATQAVTLLQTFYAQRYPNEPSTQNQIRFSLDVSTNTVFVQAAPADYDTNADNIVRVHAGEEIITVVVFADVIEAEPIVFAQGLTALGRAKFPPAFAAGLFAAPRRFRHDLLFHPQIVCPMRLVFGILCHLT